MPDVSEIIFVIFILCGFLTMFFMPLMVRAADNSSTANGLDINKIGETSKGVLQKVSDWFNNWWTNKASIWLKNIYNKISVLLDKEIVIK